MALRLDFSPWCGTALPTFMGWVRVRSRSRPSCPEKLVALLYKELFVLWQKVRDGTLSRPEFVEQMKPIRAEVESLLLRGYFNARVSGFCKGLWEHSRTCGPLWKWRE